MKAALLSAFLFPGAGHFFLKKYITGTILAGATIAALYFVVSRVVERALKIAEKIQLGEVQLDIATITELVSSQTMVPETRYLNIASIILIFTWLIGIIDSYMAGREKTNVASEKT